MLKINEVYTEKDIFCGNRMRISRVVGLTNIVVFFIEFIIDLGGSLVIQNTVEPISMYKSIRIRTNKKVWYKLARQYAKRNQNR